MWFYFYKVSNSYSKFVKFYNNLILRLSSNFNGILPILKSSYVPRTLRIFNTSVLLLMYLLFFLFLYKYIVVFLPKNSISLLFFVNFSYIFLNIWYYFVNIYKYSVYTTSNQRFWKRTFMLFWVIEGFLFLIFIYLWLITPQETAFFMDPYIQNNFFFYIKREFIVYIIPLLLSIKSWFFLFFFKRKNSISIYIASTVIIISSIYLLFIEFFKLLQIFNFLYSNDSVFLDSIVFDKKGSFFIDNTQFRFVYGTDSSIVDNISVLSGGLQEVSRDVSYSRTSVFYFNLIFLLKFWHFTFILTLSLLSLQKLLNNGTLSMDSISFNLQNYIYLLFFFYLNFIFFFKKYFYIFLKYVYFWFYENYSLVNHILFSFNEFIFILNNLF